MATLDELIKDCSLKQKKGLHFIVASIFVWAAILVVQLTGFDDLKKNLLTFCCTAILMPLAWMFSRLLHIDFQNKENPLTKAGLLFSINQLLYLLIAMWVFNAVPDKMLMVLTMIFGAHLMPFSWLYASKYYFVLSIFIPLMALILGLFAPPFILAAIMVVIEIIFALFLFHECKMMGHESKDN